MRTSVLIQRISSISKNRPNTLIRKIAEVVGMDIGVAAGERASDPTRVSLINGCVFIRTPKSISESGPRLPRGLCYGCITTSGAPERQKETKWKRSRARLSRTAGQKITRRLEPSLRIALDAVDSASAIRRLKCKGKLFRVLFY